MSKSKGNIVNPDDYIAKYGADTLRCYLMFCGRFEVGGDFQDKSIEGIRRFLKRVWKMVGRNKEPTNLPTYNPNDLYLMHKTIKKVTQDIENLSYNTALAALMEWLNFLEKKIVNSSQLTVNGKEQNSVNRGPITVNELEVFLKLLAPFAPHMCEELYQGVISRGRATPRFQSIHLSPWPKYDEKLARATSNEMVIQVNGRVRDKVSVNAGISENEAKKLALASPKVKKYIAGFDFKTIFVADRLINFVTSN